MTNKQAESLEAMRSCLICQLCDRRMTKPATLLACAHSFCHNCILDFTENSWICPVKGCGTPVTMKGGSRESIKKNHLISAVVSSVQNIEQIIATAPANWWIGQQDNDGQEVSSAAVQFHDQEEEVVDFQMMMEEEDNDDDASSTTKEFIVTEATRRESNAAWNGMPSGGQQHTRTTMSLDQSLFPSDESPAKFHQKNAAAAASAAPPDFSCSPIAKQSSQPEPNYSPMPSICADDGGRQIATTTAAIELDRTVTTPAAAQKGDNEISSNNIQFEGGPRKLRSSHRKKRQQQQQQQQQTPISTPSDATSSGRKSLMDISTPTSKLDRAPTLVAQKIEGTNSSANIQLEGGPRKLRSSSSTRKKQRTPISTPSGMAPGRKSPRDATPSSKLDCALTAVAQNSDTNSANIQLEEAPSKLGSLRKKQRTPISTSSDPSPGKKASTDRKPRRATRVSFQQQPRVMLLNPSWTLSNAHSRCLRKCANDGSISMLKLHSDDASDNEDQFDSGLDFDSDEGRQLFLATLSSDRTSNCPPAPMSFYAISTEKDLSFTFGNEAITIPRSFPYYLAVACGLPIVDIDFLSSAANRKKRGANHQYYLFPSPRIADDGKRDNKKNNTQNDYLVLGASNYSWGTPEKARIASLDRHSLWQKEEGPHAQSDTLPPGIDLLRGYSVILLGEFDPPHHSRRTVAKRKRRRDSEVKGGYRTRGNMSLLLQLCGADVYDIDSVATTKRVKKGLSAKQWADIKVARPLGATEDSPIFEDALQSSIKKKGFSSNGIVIMVKEKSDSKLGDEFLDQLKSVVTVSQIPIVSSQWLLDSIGDFEVKGTSEYSTDGTM
eukprot:CAMPEP_0196135148 /NCGR_PEP_ID=MMETSP0910-20130528/3889_1 /TAXON_ID=49265 /ORGANISM="Thalassiosira rotula, Strain GSO102" /LENGTH=833 /DNA_ID=CAMNT_0041395247 /DNA_START=325 /DNA_END=2826 /DNA_ORIENTATION=-